MKIFSAFPAVLPTTCVVLLLIGAINADAQILYRYTNGDGHVVYTDRPPAPSDKAKDVQMKRAGANFIETDKMSAATRHAAARFPVTLYAFDCGPGCESGEALLQKRGIPYTYVDVQSEDGYQKLQALTGKAAVPVLRVGESFLVGFNEDTWNNKLDGGGYAQDAGVRTTVMHTKAPATPPASEPQEQAGDDSSEAETPVEQPEQ